MRNEKFALNLGFQARHPEILKLVISDPKTLYICFISIIKKVNDMNVRALLLLLVLAFVNYANAQADDVGKSCLFFCCCYFDDAF
jgi:hypothetical protein